MLMHAGTGTGIEIKPLTWRNSKTSHPVGKGWEGGTKENKQQIYGCCLKIRLLEPMLHMATNKTTLAHKHNPSEIILPHPWPAKTFSMVVIYFLVGYVMCMLNERVFSYMTLNAWLQTLYSTSNS